MCLESDMQMGSSGWTVVYRLLKHLQLPKPNLWRRTQPLKHHVWNTFYVNGVCRTLNGHACREFIGVWKNWPWMGSNELTPSNFKWKKSTGWNAVKWSEEFGNLEGGGRTDWYRIGRLMMVNVIWNGHNNLWIPFGTDIKPWRSHKCWEVLKDDVSMDPETNHTYCILLFSVLLFIISMTVRGQPRRMKRKYLCFSASSLKCWKIWNGEQLNRIKILTLTSCNVYYRNYDTVRNVKVDLSEHYREKDRLLSSDCAWFT